MANKENLRKWVAALRSGEYEQGKGALQKYNNYCCLGVACRVAMANGLPVKATILDDGSALTRFNEESGLLPFPVAEWLGVAMNPSIAPKSKRNSDVFDVYDISATEANDTFGWDFNKIADKIESYYKLNED